ncbi:MAG: outer membrane beta-barrel protein, partial [Candidatus Kryptoniota bacterium]
MRRLIILLSVFTLLAFSGVQAQSVKSDSAGCKSSCCEPSHLGGGFKMLAPSEGSKAFLFDFSGLSDLGANAYMGGIGGKYFLSNQVAVRAMLEFGLHDSTAKETEGANYTVDETMFGIEGAIEYHLPISSRVSPYVGGGVYFTTEYESTPGYP